VFSAAAGLSFGIPVGDGQSLATGVPRLVDAIGRDLFLEDQEFPSPAPAPAREPESFRDVYKHAIWRPDARLETARSASSSSDPSRTRSGPSSVEITSTKA
jgi:hypothetical protein